jgi:hypothetical protein
MPRVRYCIPCATGERPVETIATQTVDDDPMCDFHAREAMLDGVPAKQVTPPAGSIAPAAVPVEAPVVAMRSRACVACANLNIVARATTEFNGVPTCDHHGFMARQKKLMCSRGCGKPTHRGRCAATEGGRATLPPQRTAPAAAEAVDRDQRCSLAEVARVVAEAPQTAEERKDHLDKLVGEEIALDALPPMLRTSRNSHGRIGELMAWLKTAPEDKAFAAKCRDVKHVSQTHKGVRDAAKRLGIRFFWRRHDATYYISRSEFEGGMPAWE